MDKSYSSIIEVLIFSSDEPISESEIIRAIKGIDGEDIEISSENISDTVDLLNKSYEDSSRSFRIKKIANGFVFVTSEIFAKYVGYLSSEKSKRRLSQAALETLAIIAYKQPVTKPELEQIRGVNSDYILTTLLEKNLITITGRAESIGRPLLYGTTTEFLKYFGLYNLSYLPKPREIEEIMKDEDFIEQKNKIMMNFVEESLEKEISEDKNDDPAE
ncbi:MAG: SMC-Scp complex subunit ScpB [Ignavibacteriota bacterium]|nr:SMC-Scp complex subunit ScpB [Ignavibacteriota bacterium]MCO6447933.1 SMC-Scp complex subunit ScpB [Ignavibacterium album]QKJ99099.1 MAG: SMC-Scp complex subunit ScpB [Ignavibacteriota bacterium]HOJ07053.1 SMC-Scp complex subunit ScpB [Ignavibacteriaceae bacterium]